jgi:hypothetical protein
MSYSISITKRINGGYTVATGGYTFYPSEVSYHGTDEGVILFMQGMRQLRFYHPAEWTIQTVTGFTTVVQVCDALDALGVLPADQTAIKTLGSDTYTEAATKAVVVGAFRRDAETSMVDTTGEVAPLQVDAAGRLKVASQGRNSDPAVLVASGSAQNVTTGWVDFGAEIATEGATLLALWLTVTHANSENVRIRILGKHTASTGAEFLIPIKNVSTSDVKVKGHYYELDSDETQNMVFDWDISAVPAVQVQIQCETVGVVADTVSGDYTLKY